MKNSNSEVLEIHGGPEKLRAICTFTRIHAGAHFASGSKSGVNLPAQNCAAIAQKLPDYQV